MAKGTGSHFLEAVGRYYNLGEADNQIALGSRILDLKLKRTFEAKSAASINDNNILKV